MSPDIVLVSASGNAVTRALAVTMAREALRFELANADVLRGPPRDAVYAFLVEAPVAITFAVPIVTWAKTGQQTPGLVGIVEDGGAHEREALLAAGFDDAISAPLSTREIVARVRAVQRRIRPLTTSTRLRYGQFKLEPGEHVLWVRAASVTLTSIELAVMRELIKASGRPLSRIDLLDTAWGGSDLETTERAVDNVILRIRRKLPRPGALETVRGVGFRLATE